MTLINYNSHNNNNNHFVDNDVSLQHIPHIIGTVKSRKKTVENDFWGLVIFFGRVFLWHI